MCCVVLLSNLLYFIHIYTSWGCFAQRSFEAVIKQFGKLATQIPIALCKDIPHVLHHATEVVSAPDAFEKSGLLSYAVMVGDNIGRWLDPQKRVHSY